MEKKLAILPSIGKNSGTFFSTRNSVGPFVAKVMTLYKTKKGQPHRQMNVETQRLLLLLLLLLLFLVFLLVTCGRYHRNTSNQGNIYIHICTWYRSGIYFRTLDNDNNATYHLFQKKNNNLNWSICIMCNHGYDWTLLNLGHKKILVSKKIKLHIISDALRPSIANIALEGTLQTKKCNPPGCHCCWEGEHPTTLIYLISYCIYPSRSITIGIEVSKKENQQSKWYLMSLEANHH